MPINYDQYAHLTPQQVQAQFANGLPPEWNWGSWQATQAPGSTFDPAKAPMSDLTNTGQVIDWSIFGGQSPWGGAARVTPTAQPMAKPMAKPMAADAASVTPMAKPMAAGSATKPMAAGSATQPGGPVVKTSQIAPPINIGGPYVQAPRQPTPTPSGVQWGGAPVWAYNTAGGTSGASGPYNPMPNWQGGGAPGFQGGAAGNENRAWSAQGLDPRLDQLLNFALSEALGRYFDPSGRTFYSGQTVAGLSPEEIQAQQMLLGAANGAAGVPGAATGFLDQILRNASNPGANPQVDSAVNATLQDVTRQILGPGGAFSQIRDNSLANGSYGGTRQGVLESLALGQLADSLGGTSARMRLDARGQDLSTGLSGIGNTSNFASAMGLPASFYSGVGAQNRGVNQAFMNDELQRWLYNTSIGDTRLQNLFNSINASPLGGWGSQQNWLSDAALNSGGGTSTAQNVAGGLAGAGALWSILRNAGVI